MVFESVRKYCYDRRRGLFSAAAFVGGAYVAGKYALRKLEDVRERLIEEKFAKENLRNRFTRNQDDCIFTSQALVPTLGVQILEEMDVEGLTLRIQGYGKHDPSATSASSVADSSEHQQPSEVSPPVPSQERVAEPSSESETHSQGVSDSIPEGESARSWIEEFSSFSTGSPEAIPLPPATPNEGSPAWYSGGLMLPDVSVEPASPSLGDMGTRSLGSSFYSDQSFVAPSSHFLRSDHSPVRSESHPPLPPKTKGELWKELRTITFTRTLALIYALTLLTLQTHIQLNLLASSKYVQSIFAMEQEQEEREAWGDLLPALNANSTFNGVKDYIFGTFSDAPSRPIPATLFTVSETTEQRYLTMNWWLLNVGWRKLTTLVEEAVHDVLDRVPLKSELTPADLRNYIDQIRSKIDHSGLQRIHGEDLNDEERRQLEGAPVPTADAIGGRRINLLPVVLPIGVVEEQRTLVSGGLDLDLLRQGSTPADSASFRDLMDQTREIIESPNFAIVLDAALDWGIELFLDDISEELFVMDPDKKAIGEESHRRLAAILPSVARWSHQTVNSLPNELVEGVAKLPQVSALSAIVFTSYEQRLRSVHAST